MTFKNLKISKEEGIATVTINRPEVLNVLNIETWKELGHVFSDMKGDREVKVVIITGQGEKAFSAGADVKVMKEMNAKEAHNFAQLGQKTLKLIEELDKPVIAAINGYALGGGCELALACDILIASEKAQLGLLEITVGIIPAWGAAKRLPQLVGKFKAKEMIFTGDVIDADKARKIGLVNRVVPANSLMNEVRSLAEKLASKGSIALGLAKSVINKSLDIDLNRAGIIEAEAFAHCFTTEDQKEGMNAFLEKRKPQFKGR